MAVGRAGGGHQRPRAIQYGRVDVDRMDALRDARQWCCKQAIAATQIDRHHARLDTHRGQNLCRLGPQSLPPVRIGHRRCRKKAGDQAILTRAQDRYPFTVSSHSIIPTNDRQTG
jgi:hypothetical protein